MKEKSVFTSQITKQCQYQYYKKHPKCHKKNSKMNIYFTIILYTRIVSWNKGKLIHAGKYMYLG